METLETKRILSIISERGKNKKPIKRVCRLLYNPQLYLTAYQNLYANKGAMTKGATNETADGMSIQKIQNIIDKLKTETYRWTPVKRVYKDKSNGKQRPLGLPTWSDKLLQEVIRLILDAYYDCQFSNNSHGFRTGKGCKTALQSLTYKGGWNGVKWLIEGDISDCFGSLNHQVLMGILKENIADNRFLRLIENFLKSGFLEDWKYNETLSGCPQGGVLSPLLSNIYMDKFDQYVEHTLIPQYNTGKRREENQEYKVLLNQKRKYKRQKNWKMVKEIKKITQKMPSKNPFDTNFRRLRYIRYCDDWLIGFTGSKKEAEGIKTEIAVHLQTELKLELSQEKTLITHARSGKARFLGYDIHVLYEDTKHDKKGRLKGQRIINGVTGLRVPRNKMQSKMNKYMVNGKPIHRPERTIYSDYDIVCMYQSEFRGFVQYYLHAYNACQMYRVKYVMELSLVKTLACKHRTTVNQIYKRCKATVTTGDGVFRVLQVVVNRDGRKLLVARFGGISLAYSKYAEVVDVPRQVFSVRSELVDRLTRNVCELCGAVGSVEMHHLRKLKDLYRVGGCEKPLWMKRMIAIRRKTLAVCVDCHHKIHFRRYDGVRVC